MSTACCRQEVVAARRRQGQRTCRPEICDGARTSDEDERSEEYSEGRSEGRGEEHSEERHEEKEERPSLERGEKTRTGTVTGGGRSNARAGTTPLAHDVTVTSGDGARKAFGMKRGCRCGRRAS